MTLLTKKCSLWPYLALYMQFPWCTLFIKATPTNYMIHHFFICHINKRETPTTCLTNHKGSISYHITPLVINILGGGHTHTCIQTSQTKAISRNQSCTSWHMPGLKTYLHTYDYGIYSMYICICIFCTYTI